MRTLQEKYNAIQEGTFTKDQFLRDARLEQPNLVTRFNGYDDAVQILKNRGMISEGKVEEAKQPKLTKKALADYRYKPTNDLDKYPYEQILRGLRVELETMNVVATPTAEEYTKALAKVLKNLEKDSIYYTNQVAGVKPTKKRTDVMVDATPKNEVDKDNGLQKAQLKEAFKGLIKKILSEGNEFGEGEEVYEMQSAKSDDEYKSELAEYLEDNQIYGYTDRIHNIMTGPDEADALDRLADYLQEEGIYGYNRGIERIYADYPYDQHWMNQPDEDEDFPEIPGFEGTRDALDNLFEDSEADRNMILKLMDMYEANPSKYEKLHKEAQLMARTEKDIKYKHLLSLIDRAKAGALQRLANQDKFEADREGMEEGYEDKKIKTAKQNGDKSYSVEYEDGTKKTISVSHDDWDNVNAKFGTTEQDVFESVSLKDLLD